MTTHISIIVYAFIFLRCRLQIDPFRLQINLHLNENLKIFLASFPKFDIKFSAFHRKKIKNKIKIKQGKRKHKRNLS